MENKDHDTFGNIQEVHPLTRLSKGLACHGSLGSDVASDATLLDIPLLLCDCQWEHRGTEISDEQSSWELTRYGWHTEISALGWFEII